MSDRTTFFSRIRAAVDAFASARSVATAIEAGHRPPKPALRRLGISESTFDGMGLR